MKIDENNDFRRCTADDTMLSTIKIVCPSEIHCWQRVWKAAVLTAFQDALSQSTKSIALINKRKATNWLLRDTKDFYEVCEHAGYDPRFIRQFARKLLQENPLDEEKR